jgi:hypothetical protein
LVKDLRRNLGDLQKQIDKARAERDERWRKVENQVRTDTVRLLKRIEKAVAPPKPAKKARKASRKKATRKKAAGKKKTARKKAVRKKTTRKKATAKKAARKKSGRR